MDVHEYLGVLRRGVVFIVLGIMLGLLGGAAVQSMEGPSYSATSRDLVTNKTSGDLNDWLQASTFTQGRIASYVLVASSGLVLQPVIDDLGLETTVEDLARQITVTAPPQTFIIEITATAASPELARDIANAVSAEFADVVSNQLENGSATGVSDAGTDATPSPAATPAATAAATPTPTPSTTTLPDGTVVPISKPIAPVRIVNIEEAVLPTGPLPTNSGLLLIVGGVLGLAVGLLAASLREAFDTRVRGPKDIATVAHIPVLGDIPADRAVWTTPLVARSGAGAPIAEAFRALRAHIDHIRVRDGRHSFVLTAAGPRQGTTTVTANLAVALANTATSVVVVDADLRTSALSRLFGIHGALGLTELLAGRTTLDAALHSSDGGRLMVLPAGGRPSNPGELLATPTMREVLAELRRRFEVVLIDAPAISEVTDAAVLGSFDSSTLLVLAEGTTTRPRLEDALVLLASGGSTPIGIVLDGIPRRGLFGRRAPRRLPVSAVEVPDFVPRYVPREFEAAPAAAPAVVVPVVATPVAEAPAPAAAPAVVVVPRTAAAQSAPKPEKAPSHLTDAAVPQRASATTPGHARTSRRASSPVIAVPAIEAPTPPAPTPPVAAPNPAAKPIPKPAPEVKAAAPAKAPVAKPKAQPAPKAAPAAARTAASTPLPTDIEHSLTSAKDLDFAFAALPTATAAEQRAGSLAPEFDETEAAAEDQKVVERPIVVRPDPPRPSSRFAPDPSRFTSKSPAYASAPAPTAGTEGMHAEPAITGTVINTVSIRLPGDVRTAQTVPPPIRHILPSPTTSTIPPRMLEAARRADEADTVPPAMAPARAVAILPRGAEPAGDDRTTSIDVLPQPVPLGGSLLGEIGGLQRVEVRAARPAAVTDTAPNPEREARESYEQRARDLERAAHDRLMREQQRLAVSIREQLAHDKRELESVLDNRLEDTVLRPVGLSARRASDPRFSDPADDDGETR
jgi:capsular exopolysaccharide synthesis family protein